MLLVEPIRNFYGRFERPISSFSLLFGFILDALTLKRVDTLWENLWIFGNLLLIGTLIALIHLKENGEMDEENPSTAHFWFVNLLQFFLGGVFSALLVLYFRSSDFFSAWPFIFILLIIFIGNEFLKKHYVFLSFQISLFFLAIYSFAIFLIPVILHKIGASIFMLSGIISLVIIFIYLRILFYFLKQEIVESKKLVISLILGIFALINILYYTNLMPPIPLSLKEGEVYYSIKKDGKGNYLATADEGRSKKYLELYPPFLKTETSPVYAYSAIFSPRNLNLTIVHKWQKYNESKKIWETASEIRLPVRGGREGGFRTYSRSGLVDEGKWRVNVETESGQKIGQVRFFVIVVPDSPKLVTVVK